VQTSADVCLAVAAGAGCSRSDADETLPQGFEKHRRSTFGLPACRAPQPLGTGAARRDCTELGVPEHLTGILAALVVLL